MNKKEMYELTDRLKRHYKNARQLSDSGAMNDYYLALKPFSYADIDDALTEHIRRSKYFPDVADLTGQLVLPAQSKVGHISKLSAGEIVRCTVQMEEMLELGELMMRDYQSAGLPHPRKARQLGWSAAEWNRRCRGALDSGGTYGGS